MFVLPNLAPGGAERSIINLARHLSPDYDVHIALINFGGLLLREVPEGVSLHDLRGKTGLVFQLTSLVNKIRPRVLMSTIVDVSLIILGLRKLFPREVKIMIREAVMPSTNFSEKRFPFFWEYLYRNLYRRADHVVVLSNRAKQRLIEVTGVDEGRITVIYNAVSDERIGYLSRPTPNRKGDPISLVSVGRLEYQKGYDLLVECFPYVIEKYPNLRLTIYGEGREKRTLQRQIERLGLGDAIALAGYVDNPLDAVQQADLFVMSSRYEGMSNAMLEALCCGTPVLMANNPENSADELIIDGKNGFLVPTCSADAIEHGLLRALGECRKLDRGWIRRDTRHRFSFERYLQSYTELIERACEREPG